jgi:hypothetical protein
MEQGLISLDDNDVALEEATGELYFVNLRGKIQIEDKADIKERLGRSPNIWDARKLAIWGMQFAPIIKPKGYARKSSMIPSYVQHSYMGA